MAAPNPDNVPKLPQGNPRAILGDDTYRFYVSAALNGLLSAKPGMSPFELAKMAHQIAEQVIFEQTRRNQIFDYGYTNLY